MGASQDSCCTAGAPDVAAAAADGAGVEADGADATRARGSSGHGPRR